MLNVVMTMVVSDGKGDIVLNVVMTVSKSALVMFYYHTLLGIQVTTGDVLL